MTKTTTNIGLKKYFDTDRQDTIVSKHTQKVNETYSISKESHEFTNHFNFTPKEIEAVKKHKKRNKYTRPISTML